MDFAQLKSELQLHEKNDLTLMKQENDQLRGDVEKLKQRLREEITRTMAGVRLDLNLEKGRIRDESSQQELKIKEVDTRIESEIAGLRTQIEQAKFSILQYLVGVATGAGALLVSLSSSRCQRLDKISTFRPSACLSQNVQVIPRLYQAFKFRRFCIQHKGALFIGHQSSLPRQHHHMVVTEIYLSSDHHTDNRPIELCEQRDSRDAFLHPLRR